MRSQKIILAVAIAASLGGLSACVQLPTEKQTIVDQRPQISFRYDTSDRQVHDARVFVDDLEMGSVGDFADGKASLRVVPGTHLIRVQNDERVLMNERAYLADGAVRPFSIK